MSSFTDIHTIAELDDLLFSRLARAPQKCEFLHNVMDIIDVLAILPYFMELAMDMERKKVAMHSDIEQPVFVVFNQTYVEEGLFDEEEDNLQGVLQVFRVFKLARILKLARFHFLKLYTLKLFTF